MQGLARRAGQVSGNPRGSSGSRGVVTAPAATEAGEQWLLEPARAASAHQLLSSGSI